MTRKLHEIGCKFSQTWQDTEVSKRGYFKHSFITKISNAILESSPFNMKPRANDDWLHDQLYGRATSRRWSE